MDDAKGVPGGSSLNALRLLQRIVRPPLGLLCQVLQADPLSSRDGRPSLANLR